MQNAPDWAKPITREEAERQFWPGRCVHHRDPELVGVGVVSPMPGSLRHVEGEEWPHVRIFWRDAGTTGWFRAAELLPLGTPGA